MKSLPLGVFALVAAAATLSNGYGADSSLCQRLKPLPYQIAYECYVDGNWEIFVMNADGTNPKNLTQTPKEQEHYPQMSPDGTQIAFTADVGEGRDTVRSLWVMDIDGKHRKKLVDSAREQFWSPDGKMIGFLPQEYPKFNVIDYYTKGMKFYHLDSGKIEEHPNSANLHHLYNPGFSPNGKWIVATVHAGMGYDHAILLIEAQGNRILNLKIPGCRPCWSPDGKQLAWGASDNEIAAAPLDQDAETPVVGPRRVQILDKENKIYHVDWSPDCKFLSISRGPESEGDITKVGTFKAACEIVGVYAPGWDLIAVSAERNGPLDLHTASETDFAQLTHNGQSNKESSWYWPHRPAK